MEFVGILMNTQDAFMPRNSNILQYEELFAQDYENERFELNPYSVEGEKEQNIHISKE